MKNLVIEEIMKFVDTIQNKTIFDILDSCIEKAELPVNKNWFLELKFMIEDELKKYATEHYVSSGLIMNNHTVIKTENGFEIRNLSNQNIILKIHFPSSFNPNSVIIERSFY